MAIEMNDAESTILNEGDIDKSNQCLSSVIPVLYGALFSYVAYLFANIVVNMSKQLTTHSYLNDGIVGTFNSNIIILIIFALITFYMVDDVRLQTKVNYPS